MKSIFTLLTVLLFTSLSQAQTELLVNPNFTSENYGWTVTQDFKYNTQFSTYNFDPGYAFMPQTDHAYGILDQVVNIPSNTTSCTFSFYYKITSDEVTTNTAFDKCLVQIMDNSGNRYEFITLSNLNESSGYQYVSFNIPSSFFGKQVTIRFIGDNDGAKPTIFRIDNCSMKATVIVTKPDLSIAYPAISTSSVRSGDVVTLTADENNNSNTNAGGHYVKYYLSTNSSLDGNDTYIGSQYLSSVSPGFYGSCSKNYTIPTLSAGTYYVLFQADGYNDIDESNENNNINSVQFTVQSAPVNKPDLTVTSSFSTPSSITNSGSTVLLNVNFKNQGAGNSPVFTVKYFLSESSSYNSSTAVLLATQSYNALNTGSSSAAAIYLTIPAGLSAGTKYILSYVDPSNVIDESNENNNIGAANLVVNNPTPTKPELIITNFTAPATSTPLGSINVNCTIENIGGTAANNFVVSFHLSDDATVNAGDIYLDEYSVSTLGINQNKSFSLPLVIPSNATTGQKIIIASIDGSGVIDEQIENNNSSISYITINNQYIQALEFNPSKSHLYWPFYNSQDNTAGNPLTQWSGQFNGSTHPWHFTNNHDLDNNGEADHHTGESYFAQDWNYLTGNSDCGMSFYAPLDGTIIRLSDEYSPSANCVNDRSHSTAGNYFIILSSNGQYAFKACHFNELSSNLYVGKIILAGDYLGKIGNTGNSDGTHAHCQLYKNLNSSLVSTLRNYGKIGSVSTDYTYACDFDFDAILDGTGGDDSTATALFSNKTGALKIYPTPSDVMVTVQLGKQVHGARITVLDLLGKIVYESVEQNTSQFSIATSTLDNAPYFIHIVTEDGEYTARLVVQHNY